MLLFFHALSLSFIALAGAGLDGVEEIKRHPFFATIDWNVSNPVELFIL